MGQWGAWAQWDVLDKLKGLSLQALGDHGNWATGGHVVWNGACVSRRAPAALPSRTRPQVSSSISSGTQAGRGGSMFCEPSTYRQACQEPLSQSRLRSGGEDESRAALSAGPSPQGWGSEVAGAMAAGTKAGPLGWGARAGPEWALPPTGRAADGGFSLSHSGGEVCRLCQVAQIIETDISLISLHLVQVPGRTAVTPPLVAVLFSPSFLVPPDPLPPFGGSCM